MAKKSLYEIDDIFARVVSQVVSSRSDLPFTLVYGHWFSALLNDTKTIE